jgi:hypothetical protein
MNAERFERYSQLARNFALTADIDALTSEVVGAFGREGIEALVLKGPVLARWLYPGEVRPYVDSDLLVAPGNRARAVAVLERLGFVECYPWMPSALFMATWATAFYRPDDGTVDLHCQLPGLDGDPDAIWDRLAAHADRQVIGGVELRVPDRDVLLLHVALHAAHHASLVDGKPLEDLRRALARAEESQWSRALGLARAYRGVPVFAAGLQLLPEGRDLARRLGLGEVRSLHHEIRREENMFAEELYLLLFAKARIGRKLAIAARHIFPRPAFLRWWSPLARRGKLGLTGAYLWRAIWVIGQVPGAIHTLWRIQRVKGRA